MDNLLDDACGICRLRVIWMQFEVLEFDRIGYVKKCGIIGLRFAHIPWFIVPIWREKCRSCNRRIFMIKSFFHGQNILEISFENVL
jgi:hypothetical protein